MSFEPRITRKSEGLDGAHWNILGQVYTPKQITEECFSWHATFPIETFVPPHIHPTQDEYVLLLDGALDIVIGGKTEHAATGDLICMPRGVAHGLFNNSGRDVRCFFWVTPTGKLVDLFRRIHNMARPDEVVALSPEYEVEFLPPVRADAQL
ncbi:cupin domain-containing protein [Sulfitobacter aestuarii]|uniref:Cupin domain-containing protein n=1 Tax=Sulfitobacter aestuarii TaxID=2161676 RepID=A0ABW5U483_9RHOB